MHAKFCLENMNRGTLRKAFEYLGMGEWIYKVCVCGLASLNLQDIGQWWALLNMSFRGP
jgi:hypothetical protein